MTPIPPFAQIGELRVPVLKLVRFHHELHIKAGQPTPSVIFHTGWKVHREWPSFYQALLLARPFIAPVSRTPEPGELADYLSGNVLGYYGNAPVPIWTLPRSDVEAKLVPAIGIGTPIDDVNCDDSRLPVFLLKFDEAASLEWDKTWTPDKDIVLFCGVICYLVGLGEQPQVSVQNPAPAVAPPPPPFEHMGPAEWDEYVDWLPH